MRCTLSVLLAVFLLTIFAAAHPGRTDDNGGHYNRATGEYHYHHGFPGHQHVNGVCPYENEEPNQPDIEPQTDSESKGIPAPGTAFLSLFWKLYSVGAVVFVAHQAVKYKTKSVSSLVFNGLLSLIQFFALTLYAPLFLVSWISDKFKKNHK